MSYLRTLGFLLLALVSILVSSTSFAQEDNTIAIANNQFAFDLYSQYRSKDGNIFYSPYSISSALAMTYEGAAGKTAEEMQAVLHFPQDADARREAFLQMDQQLNKKDKQYKLSVANALWAQKGFPFLGGYFSLVDKYYGGKVTNLDFARAAEKARQTINRWVEAKTNKKIKDLIPKGILGGGTRLVLTNAIYFKGDWLRKFDKKDTKKQEFRVSSEKKVEVPMMYMAGKKDELRYGETDALQILELPYQGLELDMFIVLPREDDLKAVEEGLGAGQLSSWKSLLALEKVNVYLPKFKFETKYFMAKDLQTMGMPSAFTPGIDFGGMADFSGMTGDRKLNIDEVIHQAFVEVNEEGTEAAAATAVIMKMMAGPQPPRPPKTFKADHPFIFIIQDRATDNILFMGRVAEPLK